MILAPSRQDPADERHEAFLAVVGVVLSNPAVRALSPVASYWEGDPPDDDPAPATRYWLRFTPSPGPSEHDVMMGGLTTDLDTPMDVRVELSVPSRRLADSTRFWRLVERAIFPRDDTRFAVDGFLAAHGVDEVSVVKPGWAAPGAGPSTAAVGLLRVSMHVAT